MRVWIIFIVFATSTLSSCKLNEKLGVIDIDGGRFFRSGQMNKIELEAFVKLNGIKTIINLQGKRPGKKWFEDEFGALLF